MFLKHSINWIVEKTLCFTTPLMTVTGTTLFLLYAAFVKLPCVPFGRKLIPNKKKCLKTNKEIPVSTRRRTNWYKSNYNTQIATYVISYGIKRPTSVFQIEQSMKWEKVSTDCRHNFKYANERPQIHFPVRHTHLFHYVTSLQRVDMA